MRKLLSSFIGGLLVMTSLLSCDENNVVGGSIQPGQDRITMYYDTVHVVSETVLVDSIFSRSSTAYLGEWTDPFFGTTKADFMAQLYCPWEFSFPDDVVKIDSSFLYLYYENWFGDSAALMHVNVYELQTPLDSKAAYFSNMLPDNYLGSQKKLLGNSVYTATDMYATDSVKNLSTYYTVVRVPITTSLGERFLNDFTETPGHFSSPAKFKEYFNGIYVTTDYGNGSILNLTDCELELCYGTYLYSENSGGLRDSFVVGASYFPITQEVRQINRYEHTDLSAYLNPSDAQDSLNYIFSPAGLYTNVQIPQRTFETLAGKTVNSVKLKVLATQLDESEFGMAPPENMLLIRADQMQDFFTRFELQDGLNSFLATYSSSTESYTFDLSYYAQKMLRSLEDSTSVSGFTPFYKMVMVPVNVVLNDDGTKMRLEQLLTPSAVKVRNYKHPTQPMKLEMVFSTGKASN